MTNSEKENLTIASILLTCSIISVTSSAIVVFFYVSYRRMRREFLSTMIFLLAVLDIFMWGVIIITSSYYINTNHDLSYYPNLCVFLAFFWSLSALLNYSVTLLITIALYLALIKNIDPVIYNRKMFIVVFITCLILALIPFMVPNDDRGSDTSYGPVDQVKCWITHEQLRIYCFYVPLWVIIIVNLCVFIIFKRGLNLEVFNTLHDRYQTRFTMFPLIMMVCYIISSVRRIIQAITDNNYDGGVVLEIFMYILMPLQGLFNTIVYGMFEEFIRVRIIAFMKCDCKALQILDKLENEASLLQQQEQID